LVVVRGNHDVDFHWGAVQKEFISLLGKHELIDCARVTFADWFYYEEGRVYVEHGHQYDPYCSHEHVLHPVRANDPKRSSRSLSDVLLRFVVRPTRGLTEAGHESATIFDYILFAGKLGVRGMLGLGQRFFRAVAHLIYCWYVQSSRAADWLREEHERRVRRFSRRSRVSLEKLRRLLNLQPPPVTRSVMTLLSCVMLDRVLGVAFLALGVSLCFLYADTALEAALFSLGPAVFLGEDGRIWVGPRNVDDPTDQLRQSAARISQVFPAAFVIMGHTHMPERSAAGDAVTYVNLGCWAEQDLDGGFADRLPSSRTHFVVSGAAEATRGELMVWDSSDGPRPFERAS
jgi:predicted phosphodiesterase